ncbi:MAG: hypothetical protein LBH66_02860 [Oscillospiraceae bacterium]|nr:hypothetical protein [Oscillospiraceae bacterium]
MTIKQVSVFIENSPGTLAQATRLLGDKGFDLLALSLADTARFGILRCLAKRPGEAVDALNAAGFSARAADVLAALVPDRPGGLAVVLEALAAKRVGVEYCYSFARSIQTENGSRAAIVLRVEDDKVDDAVDALNNAGVPMMSASMLDSL